MEQIVFFKASRSFVNFVEKAVTVDATVPYAFRVNKSVTKSKKETSAPAKRVMSWATANGASVAVLKSESDYWLIEITDPVAASLEHHLKNIQGVK